MYPRAGLSFLLEVGMEVTFVPPVLRVPRTAHVSEIVDQAGESHLVHFDTIDSIDLAEQLQGHSCLVLKSDLPGDYARSIYDLIGFSIVDADRNSIGTVVDIEENPAHPLLVVEVVEQDKTDNGEGELLSEGRRASATENAAEGVSGLLSQGCVASGESNPGTPPMNRSSARLVRVPLVEDFIVELDPDEELLVLNLPDGLLDL